ncbi:PLP-dependent aminotransferase family protein [Xylanimonas ulmi]|uniref:GntR family transcriptional regulator n=1 Tax=Xylanimonas ulmi TaxID=228973 RepID=A0A4Q7M0H7_9MICO|nr:GntR family transcriptional regulator [Xylanibacterium ulmi]
MTPCLALDPAVRPATERVVRGVVRALRDGLIKDGDPMPSSRALADASGIARSSVVCAYERLAGMGVLIAVQGRATAVRLGAARLVDPATPEPPRAPPRRAPDSIDLSVPGGAASEALDPKDWNRAWRRAIAPLAPDACLSDALVDFLRTTRGIVTTPEELVLRPSLGAALGDVIDAFDLTGREIAIEDPCLPGLQRRLAMSGCRVRCVPVDEQGLRVDLLGNEVAAVHVTPARQWPTGAPLSAERRAALLDWSRRTGGVIIENDHDALFVFDSAPSVPLFAQARGDDACENLVYLGSSAKLVATDLQVVWLVGARRAPGRDEASAPVCGFTARALADYLTSGALYRQHARTLRLVQDRRDALVAALAARAPTVRVRGAGSGTEAVVVLPAGADPFRIARAVREAGFRCSTLGDFAVHAQRAALVVDYSNLPALAARGFAVALASALGPGAERAIRSPGRR